jgi:hypothetical protein
MDESGQMTLPRSRRSLLAAAAGGAAALAATAIRPDAAAAVATNMQTETDNPTTAPTGVTNSTSGSNALFGAAAGDGTGVDGTTSTGMAVRGVSAVTSDPLVNVKNAGVVGIAGDPADIAANIALSGVYGYSDPSSVEGFVASGVWGDSADIGVIGSGSVGTYGEGFVGAVGYSEAAGGAGVEAIGGTSSAVALHVVGRAEFTRSGRTSVGAGKAKKEVTLAGCTTSTLIIATMAANRSGRWVRAVVPASGKFTIYLNSSVSSSTQVAWIALTNPVNHSG